MIHQRIIRIISSCDKPVWLSVHHLQWSSQLYLPPLLCCAIQTAVININHSALPGELSLLNEKTRAKYIDKIVTNQRGLPSVEVVAVIQPTTPTSPRQPHYHHNLHMYIQPCHIFKTNWFPNISLLIFFLNKYLFSVFFSLYSSEHYSLCWE